MKRNSKKQQPSIENLKNVSKVSAESESTAMQLMKIIMATNESIRKDHGELIALHKQIVETNAKLAEKNSELAKKMLLAAKESQERTAAAIKELLKQRATTELRKSQKNIIEETEHLRRRYNYSENDRLIMDPETIRRVKTYFVN